MRAASLLAWAEQAIDLLEQLRDAPPRPGIATCAHDFAATIVLLRPSVDDTDWGTILVGLERWEAAYQPVLALLPLTRSPSRQLREILESPR